MLVCGSNQVDVQDGGSVIPNTTPQNYLFQCHKRTNILISSHESLVMMLVDNITNRGSVIVIEM